jgi:anti-anti-sigma factor
VRKSSVQIHQQPHFGDAIRGSIQLASQNRRAAAKLLELDVPWQNGVPANMTLAIRRERTTDGFVVRLIGDLDERMAGTVTQAITAAPELSVVVDLSDLNSLDDAGLRGLVEAGDHLSCDGRALSVVGARGDVMAAIRCSDLMGFT